MRNIVWLASYPKSGNTWLRAFLTNFLLNRDTPADINWLNGGPIASDRESFDDAVGFDAGEMTYREIEALRPEVYLHQARRATDTLYCKVHDAYTFLPDGRPLFPPEATKAVLYVVRNPFDVAVSFTHHRGGGAVDAQIRTLADSSTIIAARAASEGIQLPQRLLSWGGHAASWLDAPGLTVHCVRFEDMKRRPDETFGGVVRFLGLPDDPARVQKAVAFSQFEEMQRQEKENGFGEKLLQASSFFRKGEVGSWREGLTPEQIAPLTADHADALQRFGYLDETGRLVP